jgi:hypothetical protein
MITAVLTFLGSSAGGAILGFVLDYLDRKHEQSLAREDRKVKVRLAELDAIAEHTKQLDATTPGTLKEITRTVQLGTWKYEIRKWKLFPTNVVSPRARVVAGCVGLLVLAYISTMLIFAIEPNWAILTLQPDPDPTRLDLLFLSFEWTRSEPFTLNSGGVAYLMAHPLVFIISTAIVGTARKLGK